MELWKELEKYGSSGNYPFHMPGHKRNRQMVPFPLAGSCDITEIHGFDNLHKPEGILKEAMEHAARVCHSEHTYFLVNGSSAGNLAGILACTHKGDTVLVARNCHKSVYHGLFLHELTSEYLYPRQILNENGRLCEVAGGIFPEDVEKALHHNADIKLVIITSPTYEGIISDIGEIAKIVHKYGKILLVDEAHGAHLGLGEGFLESAVTQGADLVVQSPHKTLAAYTQSGVLHLNGNRVDKEKLEGYLSILQSSSPSYLLMAGLDHCYHLVRDRGRELFSQWSTNLDSFYQEATSLSHLSLLHRPVYPVFQSGSPSGRTSEICPWDKSKLVIFCRGTRRKDSREFTGNLFADLLRQRFGLEMEMSSLGYVLAMTGIGDRKEGFDRLTEALWKIDEELDFQPEDSLGKIFGIGCRQPYILRHDAVRHQAVLSLANAMEAEKEWVPLEELEGRVAADFLNLYPPGIPIAVPGESYSRDLMEGIKIYRNAGIMFQGMKQGRVLCVRGVKD